MTNLAKRMRPNSILKNLHRFGEEMDVMDRFIDDLFHFHGLSTLPGIESADFSPQVDFIEKKDLYETAVELPGLDKEDVDISINDNNILVIKGEKKAEQKEEGDDYCVCERSYGSFRREIRLPDNILKDNIDASFEKGVLSIKIPKQKKEKPESKKIEIK